MAAYSILGDQAHAEEVAQQALLKAFTLLGQLHSGGNFRAWLFQITVNEARIRRQRERQHIYASLDKEKMEMGEGDFMPNQFADWSSGPSKVLESKEVKAAVLRALDRLSQKFRQVFVLRDVQRLSVAETAEVLGISIPAVKTQLRRARLRMREEFAPIFRKR